MIPYTYEVLESTPKGMTLKYESPGREPVIVGAPAPAEGQTLADIAWQFSPVAAWMAAERVGRVIEVGTVGTYTPPESEPVTLESAKRAKIARIAEWRYGMETAGLYVGDFMINTERDSQAIIGNTLLSMREGLIESVNWKMKNGEFVTLGLAEMAAIAGAVAKHVQACFSTEAMLIAQVEAAQTIAEVAAVHLPEIVR